MCPVHALETVCLKSLESFGRLSGCTHEPEEGANFPSPAWEGSLHFNTLSPPPPPTAAMQGNASPAVIWQCVKQSNSYMRKSKQARHTTILSAEKGNLYNVHSYKFSGGGGAERACARAALHGMRAHTLWEAAAAM